MIPTKLILPIIAVIISCTASYFAGKFALESSEKSGTIKQQEKTISLLKSNVDSLQKALEGKPTNANTINIDIDKLKAKKNGQIILDATQLQALACDTSKIISWYNSLSKKEKRRF